jgi:hypothetical protein
MRAHAEAPAGIVRVRARRSVRGAFAIAVLGIGVLLTSMALSQGAPGVVAIDVLFQVWMPRRSREPRP